MDWGVCPTQWQRSQFPAIFQDRLTVAHDGVDTDYLELCRDVQASMREDPQWVERGIHLQAVAKFLERIGDHCTNLAEQVVFLVKGKDIRHSGKL